MGPPGGAVPARSAMCLPSGNPAWGRLRLPVSARSRQEPRPDHAPEDPRANPGVRHVVDSGGEVLPLPPGTEAVPRAPGPGLSLAPVEAVSLRPEPQGTGGDAGLPRRKTPPSRGCHPRSAGEHGSLARSGRSENQRAGSGHAVSWRMGTGGRRIASMAEPCSPGGAAPAPGPISPAAAGRPRPAARRRGRGG